MPIDTCKKITEVSPEDTLSFYLRYIIIGFTFGIIAVKSEILSWFRIQEMFRFNSIHMYGIIGTAVITATVSVLIIKRLNLKTIDGKSIYIEPKQHNKGQIIGGLVFGIGWALTGACPGPIFALIGSGVSVAIITFISALLGTWCYGYFKNKLPH